ncbi:MAG: TolB family protein [bacterium]
MRTSVTTSLLGIVTLAAVNCSDGPTGPASTQIRAIPGSERQITTRADFPDWAPDGSRIAFVSEGGAQTIWTTTPDGAALNQVTDYVSYLPNWAPDGSRIACTIFRGEPGDITARVLAAPVAGGLADTLTPPWMLATDMDWSPDGASIVVAASVNSAISNLWVGSVETGDFVNLTADSTDVFSVAWSPDGQKIAYGSRLDDGTLDIWLIAADGHERWQLTSHPENEVFPTWSPDGRWIAFESGRSGNHEIWAMPTAGGQAVQLTEDPGYEGRPDWSPDGRSIAFMSQRNAGYDIWSIDIEAIPTQAR